MPTDWAVAGGEWRGCAVVPPQLGQKVRAGLALAVLIQKVRDAAGPTRCAPLDSLGKEADGARLRCETRIYGE